ncbi:MAG: hypothetical protein P9M11_11525 [Candidatus Tenebribacter burtonii]|jgi:hypothetical protein|nr:hypothetical protein [Candidatus Tenebribacter burtonii]
MKIIKFIVIFSLLFSTQLLAKEKIEIEDGHYGEAFWDGNTFVQKCVDASKLDENKITAFVDGVWQEFELTDFPEMFMSWNIKERIGTLEGIAKGDMPKLEGPHNAIVATYGYRREDSKFRVNNAIKGCGFLPKREKIKKINQMLSETDTLNFMKKLEILKGMYENADSLFDLNKQISLELYATPERGTQTFLNQMTDPTSVMVFMAIPTFKLKTIAYLLHPENPELTDYEKDVVEYINRIHSYFHGEFSKEYIAVIYNIVEVYNSSPGNKNGRGTFIVP